MTSPAFADPVPAQLANSSAVTDWIVKDVCVDTLNRPVPFDAYYACPAGTVRRKIQPGDPLPYNNFDQGGKQGADAFPLFDARGNPLYVHTIENPPYNQFHFVGDGNDFYSIDNQWFSAPEPPPINESGSGVILDRIWTLFTEEGNGTEAVHGGADHWASAAC